jgi:TIR domain
MPVKIFFSYSHRDEPLRDQLEKHLSPLKRSAIIETWHDRRIGAGNEFDKRISQYLESAGIVLLLISADFLSSEYCYDREMRRALERHEAGEARVIPVILHACDWRHTPFGKLLAVPTDGRPVSKWPDQNEAFLDIVSAIRQAATEISGSQGMSAEHSTAPIDIAVSPVLSAQPHAPSRPRSSNLRVQKSFTDRERDRFERDAFEYIANFFEASLAELSHRNAEVETDFQRVDATHFMSVAYSNGQTRSEVTVWLASRTGFGGSIAYYRGRSTQDTTIHGSFRLEDDGHMLFLTPLVSMRSNKQQKLSFEGTAEMLWEEFIEPLQRGY